MNNIDELMLLAGVRETQVEMRPLNMADIVAEAQQRLTGRSLSLFSWIVALPRKVEIVQVQINPPTRHITSARNVTSA